MTDKLDPKMRPVNGNAARVIFAKQYTTILKKKYYKHTQKCLN